ncbi:MAG: glycoside hydrolase family 9 protein [Haliscomenobacter sp.]|nr:glycoside hydrolase family 9 protein [Haliscomenobacter sp.]
MNRFFVVLLGALPLMGAGQSNAWVRINQMGYLPEGIKVAVLGSQRPMEVSYFSLHDALTEKEVFRSAKIRAYGAYAAFDQSWRLDFSDFKRQGAFYILAAGIKSPVFRIGPEVYAGSADVLLRYMRQQRSGYNPYLRDSCHTQDGFIVYHPDPAKDSTYIDVSGGWHDASDYLQYLPTSANAVFQMLFAYKQHPEHFGDAHDASGLPGANGIPDILDEAKWGMDWLLKMNPGPGEYYNQLADDRDHLKMRLPTEDSVLYATDKGFARPAYFITGTPQGAFRYKNRTQGVSSSAGKFASSYALGSQVLAPFYPEYASSLVPKALDAYAFGKTKPGNTQTAPCRAPYFYEEDNWVDDMELAAAQLYEIQPRTDLLREAIGYGEAEPVTPWMGADTARHYQWYPFMNMGHYVVAKNAAPSTSKAFQDFMRRGIDSVWQRGKTNPFLFGVPFIWCSNNLVTAMLTQCRLYHELSGDPTYLEMEAALRDWLFGCNPWGTSMVIGLPENGIYPKDPHSAFTHLYQYPIDGGLVDGPIYGSIWNKLIGITLYQEDEYAAFQSPLVIYHDDYGDYSSNEPTMDGTACLTYYLSALENAGSRDLERGIREAQGAVVRGDLSRKEVFLFFTGHDAADGAAMIQKTLRKEKVAASFFFTGDFLRRFPKETRSLKKAGHYIGPHSDKHLLYCSWENRDSLLVTKDGFISDLKANYTELEKLGIAKEAAPYFIPPFEWYNQTVAQWSAGAGVKLINFTPGTGTNADYTWPELANYRSSADILQRILDAEKKQDTGLNGAYLLLHIGTDARRKDKFYPYLGPLIRELKARGYTFGQLAP